MARLRHDYGLQWRDLCPFMARKRAINGGLRRFMAVYGGFFGRFLVGFWSVLVSFWLARSVFSLNNTDSRPDNSGSYGGLWRDLVGFGRFWSLLVVPKAVCQECIKWPVYGPLGLLRIY